MTSEHAEAIEADYVVIGAGAMGMAFVDEVLTHSDATVAMIDRRSNPGGHWNDSYPHVRLHQPSFFYGVTSTRLGTDQIDEVGLNAGLSELASGVEVCAYYDHLMQRRFLPSGRLTWHPTTSYTDGVATSSASGASFEVTARRAIVDATYMNVTVPSTRPPAYEVDAEVQVITPNALPGVQNPAGGYCVVGAGKTAFDAILWLLEQGVEPAGIRWIVPRDSWLINRAMVQPGDFRINEQIHTIAEAASASALFAALEEMGQFLRVDPSIEPTMYRCATVTEAELAGLRRIEQVIRLGRVRRIRSTTIELAAGEVETHPETVYVDCTADGLERRPVLPVFGDAHITLQTVRACQQVFSAAFLGRLECLAELTIEQKNELAGVIPHPNVPADFLGSSLGSLHNGGRWAQVPELADWLAETRLSPGGATRDVSLEIAIQAAENLERFVAEA